MRVAILEKLLPFLRDYDVTSYDFIKAWCMDVQILPLHFTMWALFIYLLRGPSIFIRAAEDLLSRIQKNYQKPQREVEVLKEAASSLLSKRNGELRAARGLVREAEVKTQEGDRLLHIVSANLREFKVSLFLYI